MSIHRFLRPCRTLGFVLLIVGAFNIASAHEDAGPIAVQMVSAANEFLDTLTPELKQQITFKFDGPERTDWHFIPKDRTGVKLKDLSLEQRRAAHHLLHTTLSSAGYLKATSIMNLENVLRLLESDQADVNQRRDPEKYWLAIYGTPSTDQPWGWRIEGHHLSLNFSTVEGIVASTPLFLGANPAEVRVGPSTGLRVLGEEEDMARGLLAMLNEEQRQQATIATEAPKDVITAPENKIDLGDPAGISWEELRGKQRQALMRLVRQFANNLHSQLSNAEMQSIQEAGREGIHFAWAGSHDRGKAHYFRIHGPTFIIEYDNTQNDANHVHAVWHSLKNDFNLDTLRQHHADHPH